MARPRKYCSGWRVMHLYHLCIDLYHLRCHLLWHSMNIMYMKRKIQKILFRTQSQRVRLMILLQHTNPREIYKNRQGFLIWKWPMNFQQRSWKIVFYLHLEKHSWALSLSCRGMLWWSRLNLFMWTTSELTKLPKGKKVIGCKWVFAKKDGSPDGTMRYKARLVVKSYAQREAIDYNKVFAPVVKHFFIRILLALIAQYNYELD